MTRSLFADDSVLSRLVAQLQDGDALPPEVQAVRDAVADILLMDSVAEGPHAAATKIGAASRASTWPWIASSMRLKQNISEVEQWRGNGTLDVQALWNVWSSIIQKVPHRAGRAKRCTRESVLRGVYFVEESLGREFAQKVEAQGVSVGAVRSSTEVGASGTPARATAKLLVEWCKSACPVMSFISMPAPETSDVPLLVYQILSHSHNVMTLRTTHSQCRMERGDWLVQLHEVWRAEDLPREPQGLDVFAADTSVLSGPTRLVRRRSSQALSLPNLVSKAVRCLWVHAIGDPPHAHCKRLIAGARGTSALPFGRTWKARIPPTISHDPPHAELSPQVVR